MTAGSVAACPSLLGICSIKPFCYLWSIRHKRFVGLCASMYIFELNLVGSATQEFSADTYIYDVDKHNIDCTVKEVERKFFVETFSFFAPSKRDAIVGQEIVLCCNDKSEEDMPLTILHKYAT